ncbi:hypothetical protein R3W88_026701 [Solanum pinnatisectum]|uniref:Uncharacterized protein n=1 Tax=Solanum pinnatisectum TaxID=50273 RepID=A0AAV9LE33_9SOLN|nr:hypothetical protein R3W88_026701 [Solanum pinnatisectum]
MSFQFVKIFVTFFFFEIGKSCIPQHAGLCWPPPKFTKESWIVTRNLRKKFWEKAVDIDELCSPGEAWWGVRRQLRDDFNHSNQAISYAEHFKNSRFVESVLDVYWELPPVAGPSLTHQMRYDPARASSPIVEDGRYGLFRRLVSVINSCCNRFYSYNLSDVHLSPGHSDVCAE